MKHQESCHDAWLGYKRDGNVEDRNTIALAYLRYAYAIACDRYPAVDSDECQSAAHWLLFKAIREYDPERLESFAYFLRRRLVWDLRDHFYKNRDCPDRAMRRGISHAELHENIPLPERPDASEIAAVLEALGNVSPEDQELVVNTVLGHERIQDVADRRGWGYNKACYQRQAALLAMKTGGRCRIPWTRLVPGQARRDYGMPYA